MEPLAVKASVEKDLLKLPGVRGVGYSAKKRDGVATGELAIRVYVEKKKSLNELPVSEHIPSQFKKIKTDIIEMGSEHQLESKSPDGTFPIEPDQSEYRPLVGGCLITVDLGQNFYGSSCMGICWANTNDQQTIIGTRTSFFNSGLSPRVIGQPSFTQNTIIGNGWGYTLGGDIAYGEVNSRIGCLTNYQLRNDTPQTNIYNAVTNIYDFSNFQAPTKIPVSKYGWFTRGTTGIITDFDLTYQSSTFPGYYINQLYIEGDDSNPDGILYHDFDSGAMVLQETQQIEPRLIAGIAAGICFAGINPINVDGEIYYTALVASPLLPVIELFRLRPVPIYDSPFYPASPNSGKSEIDEASETGEGKKEPTPTV